MGKRIREFEALKRKTQKNLQASKDMQKKIDKLSAAFAEEFAILANEKEKREEQVLKYRMDSAKASMTPPRIAAPMTSDLSAA